MNLEVRAMEAARSVAEFNGLNDEHVYLLHTQYLMAADQEKVLHEGEEGTFGQAIESLKFGRRVARKGWNGKGMFLWLKYMTTVKSEWCKDPKLKELVDANGGEMIAQGTICMKTEDNMILTGWLASQTDMLSNDWILI